jgi:hypothetical protein
MLHIHTMYEQSSLQTNYSGTSSAPTRVEYRNCLASSHTHRIMGSNRAQFTITPVFDVQSSIRRDILAHSGLKCNPTD